MNMLQSFSGSAANATGDATSAETELKERLIASVKKEVKQLMEEAVTKKYVHEESSSVTSLCGAVEACLSHGLRRRALGLFKTSSTTALIQKIAKICPEADYVSRRLLELELAHESPTVSGKRSSSSSDSIIKPKLISKQTGSSCSSSSVTTINTVSNGAGGAGGAGGGGAGGVLGGAGTPLGKYLWIRLALYEKRLAKIIEHLVGNASNYYDREALVADADYGSILSSLLVGPCALEFTRAKTADHYWSDPCADELVQRHRISSGNRTPPTCHRPIINFKRSLHTSSEDTSSGSFKACSPASVAKDYVESLHQNSRTTLLYGKNNVLVLPKDVSEPMPGYLSLHQSVQSLTIKWTPNQLMNGYNDGDNSDKSFYWSYALNINVDEIVYVHCHQNRGGDTGGTIILVGQDGVQRPPIHFPEGGHLQAFLSCLETGLLPHGQLDPPLWSQRGIGKLFPWPKSVRRHILPSVMEASSASSSDETPIDYVFRVVSKSQHEEFLATHPILELGRSSPRRKHLGSCSTTGSSDCSSKSLSIDQSSSDPPLIQASQTASIELVCSTMRRQIISRAFYGWLAYCRHLSTVRTHLSGLVYGRIMPDLAADEEGLTRQKWLEMHVDGVVSGELELYRLVYFGGVQPDLRQEVWPYLLGHYAFGSTPEDRKKQDETCKHYYETTMSEWLAVEAIVRQREKEKTALAVAKLSAEQARLAANANGAGVGAGGGAAAANAAKPMTNGSRELELELERSGHGQSGDEAELGGDEGENDVFDDNDFSDISDPGDLSDEPELAAEAEEQPEEDGNEKTDEEQEQDQDQEQEQEEGQLMPQLSEQLMLEFQNLDCMEPLHLQENCFADSEAEGEMGLGLDAGGNILLLSIKSSPSTSSYETVGNEFVDMVDVKEEPETEPETEPEPCGLLSKFHSADDVRRDVGEEADHEEEHPSTSVIITEAASLDALDVQCNDDETTEDFTSRKTSLMSPMNEDITVVASLDALQEPKSACVSPASSNGGVYSVELLEQFGLNLHRIEKDVQRCDRNYWYFANENLDKLRNVISTYVWEHLDVGYMQGMCDLVAPLLVIFDDESLSYSCFCKLMERMIENFPSGGAMDMHFANMRSLIQILDSEMYDLMDSNGDYTHFYFCYRWFLLDFKRELVYDDVFATWEVIWAAKHVASGNFVLFLALALLETYRDIILSNSMDFTDVIKFFNEMAERHNAQSILQLSRSLVLQLQTIIENK
ncbi:small G protein signaling modulator 2 [Drosophila obscura]|uniref:small G protein signaling modulator 2 n=1 Tax=Drosophila obscura TaxID=7282 RepID=UPI001BB14CF8|nr:small G protein signaling modulator 2 [Drosophila obscura]